jgi:hypothetical protein
LVKIPKNRFFFLVFASWARNGKFEHFFEKNDLCPLRVKEVTVRSLSYLVGHQPQKNAALHYLVSRRL